MRTVKLIALSLSLAACEKTPSTAPALPAHIGQKMFAGDVGTDVGGEASSFCPSSGSFSLYQNGTQFGPYVITPLWSNCRDFNYNEKWWVNNWLYPQMFNNPDCRDVAMELYAMVNGSPARMRVADGTPRFPSPNQDIILNGSTHPSVQTMVNQPVSFVSYDRVASLIPSGEAYYYIVHEATHSWSLSNHLNLSEQDVVFAAHYCVDNL